MDDVTRSDAEVSCLSAAGAQACVPKPFRKEGLIPAIEAILAAMSHEKPPASQPPAQ